MKLSVILLVALAVLACLATQIRSDDGQNDSSKHITDTDVTLSAKTNTESKSSKTNIKTKKWQRKAKNEKQKEILDVDQESKEISDNESERSAKKSKYWKKRMEDKLNRNKEAKADGQADANEVEAAVRREERIKKWRQRKQQKNNDRDDEENMKEAKKRWRENRKNRKFANKKNENDEPENEIKDNQRGRSRFFLNSQKSKEFSDASALTNQQKKLRRNKKVEKDEFDEENSNKRPSRWQLRKQNKQNKDTNEEERNEVEGDNQKKKYNRFRNFRKNLNDAKTEDEEANKNESNAKLGGWRAKKFKSIEDKIAKNTDEDKRVNRKYIKKAQKEGEKQEKNQNSVTEKPSLDNAIALINQ